MRLARPSQITKPTNSAAAPMVANSTGRNASGRDGEIAHAYRSDMRVIYSNGSGNTQLGGNAGWDHVIANATNCAPPQPVSKLRRLDPATGSSVVIGSTGVGAVAGLAYHAASRTLYGITGFEGRHSRLVKLNVATGAATVVGSSSGSFGDPILVAAGSTFVSHFDICSASSA